MTSCRCPVCEQLFESEQSPAMPFCSDRCRWVDLARWLDEDYGVAREVEEDTETEE